MQTKMLTKDIIVLFLQRFFRQARCSMPISQNIGFGDLFL
jgi:hypothetical protein